jgi:[ribosomal protein S5]-alanine N-acetyltransferase
MNIDIGNGIQLTEFRRTDKNALIEYLSDREVYERTLRIPHPYSAADADRWLDFVDTAPNKVGIQWAIRNEAGKLIGGIGLEGFRANQPHRVEIGYWLAKSFWGRGIMTAAVKAVCQIAFEKLDLVKITAHVFSFNDASARVLEKNGFAQEGFCPKHYIKDGAFIDVRLHGLVRSGDPPAK